VHSPHYSFLTALEEAPESHLHTAPKEKWIKHHGEAEVEEECGEGQTAVMGGPVG